VMMLGGGPVADIPIPRFIRLLASPIGALLVRLPTSPGAQRSQLEAIGHGRSLAVGRMDDFVAWRLSFARETASMRHERAMVRALVRGSRWRPSFIPTDVEIGAVRQPVRMLVGSEDPTAAVDVWRGFTSRLPDAELEVLDGAGHMPWWDDPEAVGRSVRAFLNPSPP
jgi:pimeloyl-ACP methyl ester carboxylesterase